VQRTSPHENTDQVGPEGAGHAGLNDRLSTYRSMHRSAPASSCSAYESLTLLPPTAPEGHVYVAWWSCRCSDNDHCLLVAAPNDLSTRGDHGFACTIEVAVPAPINPREARGPAIDDTANTQRRREIVIPHGPASGPVTAVRNIVIQSSLAQLRDAGQYERYVALVPSEVLEELLSRLGPGWIPVELALAHYQACESLSMTDKELAAVGMAVGNRLQDAILVSSSKKVRDEDFDLWSSVRQLHRMWPRLYQGGSVQVVKLGPKEQLLEQRGFPMNRFRYFRLAQIKALAAAYAALGAHFSRLELDHYDPLRDEVAYHLSWV
jgi:hypothetical protein